MNLESFTGPGSTPNRRRLWDKITAAVNASQKVQGENVSVEEHQGMGTLIDVPLTNRRPTPSGTTGGCCIDGACSILSESDCTNGGGNYLGNGTTCDGVDCTCGSRANVTVCKCGFDAFIFGGPPCYSTLECDSTLTGEIPCNSFWLTNIGLCCPSGDTCFTDTYDPVTCEISSDDVGCPEGSACNSSYVTDEYTDELLVSVAEAKLIDTYGECAGTIIHTFDDDHFCVTACCVTDE